jgi:hypothetical protein
MGDINNGVGDGAGYILVNHWRSFSPVGEQISLF